MSIHPATAAMLMYLAKPYLKENAQILDPCCGVGTMLIERDILVPAREKYGIDIFGDAIDMARENAALAGEKINFIHRDYFDFKHDYKFDEIVTNMPVKGKKAKEDMDAFYARFFEKSKSLLAEDGIIIMYSNEVGFVKKHTVGVKIFISRVRLYIFGQLLHQLLTLFFFLCKIGPI